MAYILLFLLEGAVGTRGGLLVWERHHASTFLLHFCTRNASSAFHVFMTSLLRQESPFGLVQNSNISCDTTQLLQ